jgi:hypothetical protein
MMGIEENAGLRRRRGYLCSGKAAAAAPKLRVASKESFKPMKDLSKENGVT